MDREPFRPRLWPFFRRYADRDGAIGVDADPHYLALLLLKVDYDPPIVDDQCVTDGDIEVQHISAEC